MFNPHDLNDDYGINNPCLGCKKESVPECEKCAEQIALEEEYKYECAMEDHFQALADITRPDKLQQAINNIEFAAMRIENITKTL